MTTPTPCGVLDGLGDLRGEALLDLQTAGKSLDEPRNFAQADDLSVGNIGDVHFAEKGQQVVFAKAEHLDVFHDHHLVVANRE